MFSLRAIAMAAAAGLSLIGATSAFALNPQPLPPGIYDPSAGVDHALSQVPIDPPKVPLKLQRPDPYKNVTNGNAGAFEPPDPCLRATCQQ